MSLTFYGYWRATAPYRVRIGLALKGLAYDYVPIHLLEGDQHKPAYRAVNPQRLTPALGLDDGEVLTQSVAILEWLDETHPEPPLMPKAAIERARVRAMVGIVACDIHPLNNLRVARALQAMGVDAAKTADWTQRWIVDGFKTLEPMVEKHGRGFAYGDAPTLADCLIVPQVFSAERYKVDMAPFPAIAAAAETARAHPAFEAAAPQNQPDAQPAT